MRSSDPARPSRFRGGPRAMAVALLLCASAAPLAAQGVKYTEVSRFEMGGAAGAMVKFAAKLGGGSLENTQTVYLTPKRMRTDLKDNSTVMDLVKRQMIDIDRKHKQYSVISIEEMAAAFKRAGEQAKSEGAAATPNGPDRGDSIHVQFHLSTERTGKHEKIAGHDAEQVLLTLAMNMQGRDAKEQMADSGTFVVFTDMWVSKEAENYDLMRQFQANMADVKDWQGGMQAFGDAMKTAFAGDPRISVGFDRAEKEAKKVDGVPLRSTIYFVALAPETKFDAQLALGGGEAKPKKGGGLGGFAKKALAGKLGGEPKEENAEKEQPKQVTILKMSNEIRSIEKASLGDDVFAIPAGYKEVKRAGG